MDRTVTSQPLMEAHGLVPLLTLMFNAEQTVNPQEIHAHLNIAASYSTMQLDTYQQLYPDHAKTNSENEHNYSVLISPLKNYSLISYKLIECNFMLQSNITQHPVKTLIHIIDDTAQDPPKITLGTNFLQGPTLNHIAKHGIYMENETFSLIPYTYISQNHNKHTATVYKMTSPTSAKVHMTTMRTFRYQNLQNTNTTNDSNTDTTKTTINQQHNTTPPQ